MEARAIKLNDGSEMLVDSADFARLSRFKWTAMRGQRSNTTYAVRGANTPDGRRVLLAHREIMGARPGQEMDHINGNGLDNRRANLRFITSSQNHACRSKRPPKSGFKGVYEQKRTPGKWRAAITIGTFESAEAAARAFDEIAALLWGEYARPNFPIPGLPNLPFNDEQRVLEAAE